VQRPAGAAGIAHRLADVQPFRPAPGQRLEVRLVGLPGADDVVLARRIHDRPRDVEQEQRPELPDAEDPRAQQQPHRGAVQFEPTAIAGLHPLLHAPQDQVHPVERMFRLLADHVGEGNGVQPGGFQLALAHVPQQERDGRPDQDDRERRQQADGAGGADLQSHRSSPIPHHGTRARLT
jgi:hypothetical protein